MAVEEGNDDDLAACGTHLFGTDNLIFPVVAALDQHIRLQGGDQVQRRLLRKRHDQVDGFQGRQHDAAVGQRVDRSLRALEAADGVVVVKPDDQYISELFCLGQIADVAGVQKVETAVGEDDAPALGPPSGNLPQGLGQRGRELTPC